MKALKTTLLILASLAVSFIITGGILFWGLSFLFSDGHNMSDKDMISYFNKHADQFNALNTQILSLKTKGLKRIDATWTDPANLSTIGLNQQALVNLKKELSNLNVPRGVNCSDAGIEYISYSYGLSISGGYKGFYYALTPPKNDYYTNETTLPTEPYTIYQRKSLPERGASYKIYTKINDNWYVFEEYQD